MDDDDIARGGGFLDCVGHRILPSRAAGDDPDWYGALILAIQRRVGHELRRHCDDHLGNRGVRRECLNASVENRTSAHALQLLEHAAAEPDAAASSRYDCCHLHGAKPALYRSAERPLPGRLRPASGLFATEPDMRTLAGRGVLRHLICESAGDGRSS
jgi:hypothetical protein